MKNAIAIRKANKKDLPAWQQLAHALFVEETEAYDTTLKPDWVFTAAGKKYFQEMLAANCVLLLAMDGDKPVGFMAGYILKRLYRWRVAKYAELDNLYVDALYRGQGIGSRLIEQFHAWCRKKGVHYASVLPAYDNKGAIRLYEKHQYKPTDLYMMRTIKKPD